MKRPAGSWQHDRQVLASRRWALWRTFGQKCHYCRKTLSFEESTLDHKIPRSKGGDDRIPNLLIACQPCNEAKGDRIIILASSVAI